MLTNEAVEFLAENAFRNDREWYESHKDIYRKTVVEPLAEIVKALAPTMFDIDPMLICSPKIGGSISRVRRDTRFSHDKSLYRDVAWVVFYTDKKSAYCAPSFFFEFSPRRWDYGCGWYSVEPFVMQNIRDMLLNDDPVFAKAKRAYEAQSAFELEGDSFRRSKYPDETPERRFWLDRKCISFVRYETDNTVLFSDSLVSTLEKDFALLKPMYEMMKKAVLTKE